MIAILVIDGDPAVRLTARRVLERAGFGVVTAAGLVPSAGAGPRLVLADFAAASRRALRRACPTAIIVPMSAGGGSLRKPFTPSQLLAAVRLALARAGATTARPRR
jgi:DNA-binding response OmpR family regulator